MQTFKLTPKPQSDYRLDKTIFGFSDKLANLEKMRKAGFTIEEAPFDQTQRDLVKALEERRRTKSKIDHLLHAQQYDGADNEKDVNLANMKLNELNNRIQDAKTALEITGTVKLLKF